MLNLTWSNDKGQKMQDLYNTFGEEAFYLTHYELAENLGEFSAEEWKNFLTDPRVSDYVTSELRLIQRSELTKILKDVSRPQNARSVGIAQIISALSKTLDASVKKEGPVFIVMATPLTEEERKAPNVLLG